ncbi:PRC-barrel domain-containing protein [Pedosphaera parvula]|uniref:PRC-barrel domain protein n=1 Tax=Pedosphaera parvula (strain Ellin514) TaxID=320771 RepID=B9XJP4_PEDPL|nr:PRC-barrel domain-containing protein [Pedosphaera parvula]EEF59920.1 conserved hypothetical protein [Pedosphaera parvula Ellin514]
MLHSVKNLHGYKLEALDGEIGHVTGFYFDDKDWVVRYLVADTGSWMSGHKVLISPYAIGNIYPAGKLLEVNLTRERIENSPSIDTELPVARQHERDYFRYYNWPIYWGGPGLWGLNPAPIIPPMWQAQHPDEEEQVSEANSHLRSTQEVTGYQLQALDGEIGHVEDFLIDEVNWAIRHLIVTTGHSWSGKNVLIPPQAIDKVSWAESKVFVHLTLSEIQHEPEFDHALTGHDDREWRSFS